MVKPKNRYFLIFLNIHFVCIAWSRNRPTDHGGATRSYIIKKIDKENGELDFYIDDGVLLPRGPFETPRSCPLCAYRKKQSKEEESVKTQDVLDDIYTDEDDDKENMYKKNEDEVVNHE